MNLPGVGPRPGERHEQPECKFTQAICDNSPRRATCGGRGRARSHTLRERIGHADVSVTAKIYAHKSRSTDRDLAHAIGELIQLAATGGRSRS